MVDMFMECNLVMLPTDNEVSRIVTFSDGSFRERDGYDNYVRPDGYAELFVTSPDEEIVKGDWVLSYTDDESLNDVYQYDGTTYLGDDEKIIATTNSQLWCGKVHRLPDDFISWYCSGDGKEGKVMVEYGLHNVVPKGYHDNGDPIKDDSCYIYKVKVSIHNTIQLKGKHQYLCDKFTSLSNEELEYVVNTLIEDSVSADLHTVDEELSKNILKKLL
jgi:hypothetical protein